MINPDLFFRKLELKGTNYQADHDRLTTLLTEHTVLKPNNRTWEWFHIGAKAAMSLDTIREFTAKANVVVHNAKFFVLGPYSQSSIHTDGVNRSCALNIPVTFNLGSTMSWYDQPYDNRIIVSDAKDTNDHTFFDGGRCPMPLIAGYPMVITSGQVGTLDELTKEFTKDWVPILTTPVKGPMLVNIGKWHSVRNPTDQHRVVLSVRFVDNPSYDLVSSRLV